jgi:hypothetical protein
MKGTKSLSGLLALAAVVTAPVGANAQAPATQSVASNDYADGAAWLCRPGRQDACAVDLTTTIVSADGSLSRETWRADPNAPIDCFYVYPTVSTDATTNSDMTPDEAEPSGGGAAVRTLRLGLPTLCPELPAGHTGRLDGENGNRWG